MPCLQLSVRPLDSNPIDYSSLPITPLCMMFLYYSEIASTFLDVDANFGCKDSRNLRTLRTYKFCEYGQGSTRVFPLGCLPLKIQNVCFLWYSVTLLRCYWNGLAAREVSSIGLIVCI